MASLSGVTDNVSSAVADLNAIHTTDWLKYAPGAAITKNGGGSTISFTNGGFDLGGVGRTIGWTGGTPTASGSDNNAKFHGATDTLVLPASKSVITAVLYLGTFNGQQFTLTATISDASSSPFVFTTTGGNADWNITITYSAASAGQNLSVAIVPTGGWYFYSAFGYSTAAPAAPAGGLFFGAGP